MKKIFIKVSLAITIAFVLTSCDKDFNSLGSDLLDDSHFDLERYEVQNLIAYSKATGPVQTNNLPVNSLGVYSNPFFGTTKASFVTQLELADTDPVIGQNVEIKSTDSVYLYVPYFSTKEVVNNNNVYELDSIYGNINSSINLKIYENGYFLRNINPSPNPNDQDSYLQKYYNDDKQLIENNIASGQLNNATSLSENEQFKFDNTELVIYKTDGNGNYVNSNGEVISNPNDRIVKKKIAPGMWLNLDKNFFKTKVLDAPSINLLNNTIFKEYFKGLYFKAEANPGQDGVMAMLDFSAATITIQFHSDVTSELSNGTSVTVNSKKEVVLKLKGNTINFFENQNSADYNNGLSASNSTLGDDRLYLKGGQGSVAYIDLFGEVNPETNVPYELEDLQSRGWLVNEANLTFYIDKDKMTGAGMTEPQRIYLFDATNNKVLADYNLDGSVVSDVKRNKFTFSGIIKLDENDKGVYYKIRITEHINRLLNSDNEDLRKNIRLGLSVTEDINVSSNAFLKTPFNIGSESVKFLPFSSVMSPLGTVLYGMGSSVPQDKKLKLEIYFTKPN